jgi:hypothetical protein
MDVLVSQLLWDHYKLHLLLLSMQVFSPKPYSLSYSTVFYNKGLMARTVDGSALCVAVVILWVSTEQSGDCRKEIAGQIVNTVVSATAIILSDKIVA